MSRRLGFAFGAGGSRGIAHIGFLQAMEEAGIRPDLISGCSMGAVVGACYAAGITPSEMKKAALGLKLIDLAALNPAPFHRNGLMKTTKVRRKIAGLIGEKDFSELEIPFVCVATDLVGGREVVLNSGNVVDAVVASGSIPGVFTPASIGEYRMLVDGGILERVPTKELKEMGADVIVAVDVLGDLPRVKEVKGRLVDTVLRIIDIMDTRMTERKHLARKYVDLWLEPDLGGMDQYAVKDLAFAYEEGYKLGKTSVEKVKSLLI